MSEKKSNRFCEAFGGGKGKRVLMIQPGALGDSLLSLVVAEELSHCFERVSVEMLGHLGYISVFAGRSAVSAVADLDTAGLHLLFAEEFAELPGKLADYLAGFDGAVSWLGGDGTYFCRNLSVAIQGPVAFIDRGPPAGYRGHVVEYWLSQLPCIDQTTEPRALRCRLDLSKADVAGAAERLSELTGWNVGINPYLVFHPGAGAKRKCWPREYFAEVSRLIGQETGYRVVYLLGPAEQERFSCKALESLRATGEVAGGLDIGLAATLIAGSRAFLGHDSGPTHLAAALGVPTVAIFGASSPLHWRPLGSRVSVVGGECGSGNWQQEILPANVKKILLGVLG